MTAPLTTRLRAFREAGELVREDLACQVGESCTLEEGWSHATPTLVGATVVMTIPDEGMELCVSVAAGRTVMRVLGERLLGEPDAQGAALSDVMCELANTAGGAVKRAALTDAVQLTTGLPRDAAIGRPASPAARCWTLASPTIALAVVAELRGSRTSKVAPAELREGMVVVTDVPGGCGWLLVAKGTLLTSTTAERLARLLDPSSLVEVAEAA